VHAKRVLFITPSVHSLVHILIEYVHKLTYSLSYSFMHTIRTWWHYFTLIKTVQYKCNKDEWSSVKLKFYKCTWPAVKTTYNVLWVDLCGLSAHVCSECNGAISADLEKTNERMDRRNERRVDHFAFICYCFMCWFSM